MADKVQRFKGVIVCVQVSLTKTDLEKIKSVMGIDDDQAAIHRALGIATTVMNEIREGNQIEVAHEDGSRERLMF